MLFRSSSYFAALNARTFGTLRFKNQTNKNYSASGVSTGPTIRGNLEFENYNGGTGNFSSTEAFTFNIAGNLINNGAALTFSNQSFNLNGTSEQNISGTGNLTFNNITINNSAGVNLNRSIIVNTGLLSVTNGVLNFGNYVVSGTGGFSLSDGSSVKTSNTNGLNGSITLSGTKTFNPNTNYTYNGTSAQVTGSLLPASINNLSIDNTAGVTLSQNVTVNGILYLTNGILNIGNNNITVSSGLAASILGGTVDNFINTTGTGKLTVNNLVRNTNFNFPIGHTTYSPLKINYSGTIDNFTVSVKNSFDNPPYNANYVNKQWTITEGTTGDINANLTFQWNISDENLGFNRVSDIYIGRYNGTIYESKLAALGGPGAGPFTAYATGFTAFSPFGIGNEGALPVKLASFNSSVKVREIKLSWSTADELNNSGFDIERKNENSDWVKVGFMNGKHYV